MKLVSNKVTQIFDVAPGEFLRFAEQNFTSVEVDARVLPHTKNIADDLQSLENFDANASVPTAVPTFSFSTGDLIKEAGINGFMKMEMDMLDFTISNNNEFPLRIFIKYSTKE